MPTYAVLGGTGNTGQALLKVLTQTSTNTIHVFVRSRQKLQQLSPNIIDSPQVKIFEGSLSDTSTLAACMSDTRAVFLAVAVSTNIPGCHIAQDTAHAVISALHTLRATTEATNDSFRAPRLVVLSSSALNDHLCQDIPAFARKILHMGSSNIYADLAKAETFLRAQSDWIATVFVKPGGLVHDAQKGHALSLVKQKTFLSFLDLAAGMVECAEADGETYDGKNVSVLPTAEDVAVEWWVPWFMVQGITLHLFPWLYPYLYTT